MEAVIIWYLTDNDEGKDTAKRIKNIGIDVKTIPVKSLKKENILPENINIFIFDFTNLDLTKLFSLLSDDKCLQNFQKFVILDKKNIKEALNKAVGFLHTEFLSRPINKREFILLIEKSVIIERYREVMRLISEEAESRIKTYENILDINRRDIFKHGGGKQDFKNILKYEKNLGKKPDLNNIRTVRGNKSKPGAGSVNKTSGIK
ncbi:MAG: hypothetical protein V1874_01655 [Spirochaetota bacterium]